MNLIDPKPWEFAELAAWADLYGAAPPAFREQYNLLSQSVRGTLVVTSSGLHLAHFNAALGLDAVAPASTADADAVLANFAAADAAKHYVHLVHGRSPALEAHLSARGLVIKSAWDRVVRDNGPLSVEASTAASGTEEVSASTAAEWAGFIDSVYHLPTSPWLQALVGRSGWHHYIVRHLGKIAAARTMFISPESQIAWLGIDAPVPGIMTPRYDLDFQLIATLVRAGLHRGALGFTADIETPSDDHQGPAYQGFSQLGFRVPYRRSNWMPA